MKKLLLPIFLLLLLTLAANSLLAAQPALDSETAIADEQLLDDPFADETQQLQIYDPIETVNRGVFWFNDKLYFYLFKPVAKGFRVVPEPARISLSNFFSNLSTPVRLVNSLLQFKIKAAGNELGRFVVNSTIGLAGLFDPASDNGLPKKDEDLGQTFGHYGVGSGPYLMLPIIGPCNLRDGVGRIGDVFLNPLPYYLSNEEVLIARTVEGVNELSLDKDTFEGIKKHEIDPYLFLRSAYEQNRAAKIEK